MYQRNFFDETADRSKSGSAVLEPNSFYEELVAPGLVHQTSVTPPIPSWLSSESHSSNESNDDSFELDEALKKKLLQAPKIW